MLSCYEMVERREFKETSFFVLGNWPDFIFFRRGPRILVVGEACYHCNLDEFFGNFRKMPGANPDKIEDIFETAMSLSPYTNHFSHAVSVWCNP